MNVASQAACSEIESGFHIHGGMPTLLSHECGMSPITVTQNLRVAQSEAPHHRVARPFVWRSLDRRCRQ
jgi:hypothetical protein